MITWCGEQRILKNHPGLFHWDFSFSSAQRERDLRLQKQDLIFASSIILHNARKIIGPNKMFFFSSSKWALVGWKQSQPPHHKVHNLWALILFLIGGEITLGVRGPAQLVAIMPTPAGGKEWGWWNTLLLFRMIWGGGFSTCHSKVRGKYSYT